VLEAPDQVLGQQAKLQRQSLLAQYPAYEKLSQQARQLRAALAAAPLAAATAEAARAQGQVLEQLAAVSVQEEAILREMAVRRDAADLVFPPLRSTKEIQERLPEGTALMAFFSAGGDLYAFLLNKEKYTYWRVKSPALLARHIVTLLREMGHYEQNREVPLKELADDQWKQTAQKLLATILEGSQADFTASFPELVIVPDGLLWYVPFEALQVKVGQQTRPLISRCRMRYAPTVSLCVPDGRNLSPSARTAVVLGKLYPRDDDAVAQAAFESLSKVVPRAVPLSKPPLPAPSALYASTMDQLIVLDDLLEPDQGPYGLMPIQIDRGKPGNTLADWLSLPWDGPQVVVLPGFHTAAENSLKRSNRLGPGSEVFLSVCGLMCSGARTVLISRWRTGGKSSFDIVREFVQELPHTTPADAWQRAVLITAGTPLVLEAEPRVQKAAVDEPPRANHPFFWAGYMLVDSGTPPEVAETVPPQPPAAPPAAVPPAPAAPPAGAP